MPDREIINLIRLAIELAGDGGPQPFTSEEYTEMYAFLDRIQNKEENI
jgi:hypothetical protein